MYDNNLSYRLIYREEKYLNRFHYVIMHISLIMYMYYIILTMSRAHQFNIQRIFFSVACLDDYSVLW